MRVTAKTADPGPKQVSDRRFKDKAEADKQASLEGKATPFQSALRDAESRNLKEFHWSDRDKKSSDKPFNGSRPIATRSYQPQQQPKPAEKPTRVLPHADPKVKGGPSGTIPDPPKTSIVVNKKKNEHGSRSHGTVRNNLLRKIDAAVNPDKYGAVSDHGRQVNINRSKPFRDGGKAKVASYTITPSGDKSKEITVKKLKPKHVIRAAREKGLIQ